MVQIRKGVFETNSSSVHSMTICPKEDYDKWIKGETFLRDNGKFYTLDEAIKEIKSNKYYDNDFDGIDTSYMSDKLKNILYEWDFYTTSTYGGDYEWFKESYTTKSGDEIVAFGYSGYDS